MFEWRLCHVVFRIDTTGELNSLRLCDYLDKHQSRVVSSATVMSDGGMNLRTSPQGETAARSGFGRFREVVTLVARHPGAEVVELAWCAKSMAPADCRSGLNSR